MNRDIYQRCVKDVMTRDVVSLKSADTIHEALTLMVENRVTALPVVDHRDHCVGILTTTDLVDLTRDVDDDVHQMDEVDPSTRRWLIEKLSQTMGSETIASFMSEDVATVTGETSLAKSAHEMVRNHIHHLPVVNQHGQLIGILSTMDILAEFADGASD